MEKSKQTYSIPLRLKKAAGIDGHQGSYKVAICIEGQAAIVNIFGTCSDDVEKIKASLSQHCKDDVIIESTGVYWRHPHRILNDIIENFTPAHNPIPRYSNNLQASSQHWLHL